ncbi:MAG: dihydroorotase [Rhodobacterales bacterium]
MKLLLKNAYLIDPVQDHVKLGYLSIQDGKISDIVYDDANINHKLFDNVIDCAGKYLAPGIVDVGVKICEPGERHKESFRTASLAAAAGGVTTMVTRPDTIPAIDTPEKLEFVINRANTVSPVNIYPMAALTCQRVGLEMTELGFLHDAGAVGFTDCDQVITNNKIMSRCLTYAASLGLLVQGHPQDSTLTMGASATSGKFSSLKGLPAVNPIAEKMGVERDLALVELTGVKYHFDQLSTALALEPLRRAKSNGLDVTAGVSIHHLTLNEMDIGDYRTFFKIKPPLRSESDRVAMVEAIADGTIDIISSMHTPQDEESKRLPYEEAASGAVGLETILSASLQLFHNGSISLPQLFRALSLNPAKRFNLPGGTLKLESQADLVLFDPDAPFVLNRFALNSKSKNTPYDETLMQGKVIKTFVNGHEVFGDSLGG